MKKFLLTAFFALVAMFGFAQKYNSNYKYSFWSNLTLGGSVQYQRAVFTNNAHNFGADLRMTKQIDDNWRLRGLLDVNGFLANGFDRYGKAMFGAQLEFRPFYIFADYGADWNPSGKTKIGMAGDGGLGFLFDIGRGMYMHTEVGVDIANNGNLWNHNGFVKFGYDFKLGVTEYDRQGEQIQRNQPILINELQSENRLLKSESQKQAQATEQLTQTIEGFNKQFSDMQSALAACQAQMEALKTNSVNLNNGEGVIAVILFDFASSDLLPTEEDRVADAAEIIIRDNYVYLIEGWCSNNGTPYKNQLLSEARATKVRRALIDYGVSEDRLVPVGNGQSDIDDSREQKVIIRRSIR